MKLARCTVVASAAGLIATAALVGFAAPQQGQPSQGGQPSEQPRPSNPQPRPAGPGSAVPINTAPSDPVTQVPIPPNTQPGQVIVQPGQGGTVGVGVIHQGSGTVVTGVDSRYQRPFAFQSPAYESRFTESSHRLVAMEQRLARSNQDLMKRLGEARALTGERQTTAMFDVLQHMLRDQAAMNQYLVRSRTAWSGEIDGAVPFAEDEYWNAGMTTQPPLPTSSVGNQIPVGASQPVPTTQTPPRSP
jgi:hypothetical protein